MSEDRVALEDVKAGDHAFVESDVVLIYSCEHAAYWRANGAGYTTCQRDAGRYTFGDAWGRTYHCGPEKKIIFEFAHRALSPLEAALDKLRAEIRGPDRGAVLGDPGKSKRIEINHRHEWPALWAALDEAIAIADREIPTP